MLFYTYFRRNQGFLKVLSDNFCFCPFALLRGELRSSFGIHREEMPRRGKKLGDLCGLLGFAVYLSKISIKFTDFKKAVQKKCFINSLRA